MAKTSFGWANDKEEMEIHSTLGRNLSVFSFGNVFVLKVEGKIKAYACFSSDGHLDAVFVSPDARLRGVSKNFLGKAVKAFFRRRPNVHKVYGIASSAEGRQNALERFYSSAGFDVRPERQGKTARFSMLKHSGGLDWMKAGKKRIKKPL